MKTLSTCCLYFLVLNSCTIDLSNRLSSPAVVSITMNPYGKDEEVKNIYNRPSIQNTNGSEVCRPAPFSNNKAREYLRKYVPESFLDKFFIADKLNPSQTDPPVTNKDPVPINVQRGWIKFGLEILFRTAANLKPEEEDLNKLTLIITQINYSARAREGPYICSAQGTITRGYCDGPAFLYFIPRGTEALFKPEAVNSPLENLTLHIGGLPVIDRSDQPSQRQQSLFNQGTGSNTSTSSSPGSGQQTGESTAALGGCRLEQQSPPSSSGTAAHPIYRSDRIVIIPQYDIDLAIQGRFLTRSGSTFALFERRYNFQTFNSDL